MKKSHAPRFGWRWMLRAIFPLVLLTASSVAVLAGGPLVFLDDEPLACSLSDPTGRVHVTMMNSGQAVTGLQFSIVALKDAAGARVGDEFISVQPDADNLEAFAVATFALTFSYSDQVDLSPGTYSGFLVAVAPGTAPVQRPFTLKVPEEQSTPSLAGLVPQNKTVTVNLTNTDWPLFLHERSIEKSEKVILYGSGVEALDLSDVPPAVAVLETEEGFSATVTLDPDDAVAVSPEELAARLTVSDVTHPGKYTGELQLAPLDVEEGHAINVVALVQDHWLWPLIAISFGVVLAYLVSLWMERAGPANMVRVWLEKIEPAGASAGGNPGYTIVGSVQRWKEDIVETLSQGDVDAARQALGKLDDRLEEFRILQYWASSLTNRYEELKDAMTAAGETFDPVALSVTEDLLNGHAIFDPPYVNTNLQAESKAVAAGDSFLAQFQRLYTFYGNVQQRLDELAQTPGVHQAGLPRFRGELRQIHHDLWNVTSEKALKDGEDSILVHLNKVWMGLHRLPNIPATWSDTALWASPTHTWPPTEWQKRPRIGLWEKLKAYLGGIGPAVELVNGLVLGVTLILVTLSGLAVLYPGSTFGTWDDYLKALLWGSVGQQLASFAVNLAKVPKVRLIP